MRKVLALLACAAVVAAPVAASAQRGGGFHGGGGYHGGGFRGGGFHGGYGGWRGGYGGWRGGWGGWGWGPYWGLGLGVGLASLYAYDYYSPWYYYYPSSLYAPYYDDYEDYGPPPSAPGPGPGAGYADPWNQNYSAPPPAAGGPAMAPQGSSEGPPTAACGRWVWDAQQTRYHWNNDGC